MSVYEIEHDCQEPGITLCQKNLALKTYTSKVEVIYIKYTYPLLSLQANQTNLGNYKQM